MDAANTCCSGAAFALAARAVAAARPVRDEHGDAPADEAKVLRAFVRDGRLTSIPSAWGKRRVVLEWLAQRFEPGTALLREPW